MKKLLLSICAILALGLVSCGGGESSDSETYYYEDDNYGGSEIPFKGKGDSDELLYQGCATAYCGYNEMTIYVYENRNGNLVAKTNKSSNTTYPITNNFDFYTRDKCNMKIYAGGNYWIFAW